MNPKNIYIEYYSEGYSETSQASKKELITKTDNGWKVVKYFRKKLHRSKCRDFEWRRMRIAQIYACVILYFLLKAAAFDVPS